MTQIIVQGKYSDTQFEEFKKLLSEEILGVEVHQGFTKSAEVSSIVQFAVNHLDPIDLLIGYGVGKALDATLVPLAQKVTKAIKKVFPSDHARSVWIAVQIQAGDEKVAANLYVPVEEDAQKLFFMELDTLVLPEDATMVSIGFEDGHIKVIKM